MKSRKEKAYHAKGKVFSVSFGSISLSNFLFLTSRPNEQEEGEMGEERRRKALNSEKKACMSVAVGDH